MLCFLPIAVDSRVRLKQPFSFKTHHYQLELRMRNNYKLQITYRVDNYINENVITVVCMNSPKKGEGDGDGGGEGEEGASVAEGLLNSSEVSLSSTIDIVAASSTV